MKKPFENLFVVGVTGHALGITHVIPKRTWSTEAVELYQRRIAEAKSHLEESADRYCFVQIKQADWATNGVLFACMSVHTAQRPDWPITSKEAVEILAALLPVSSECPSPDHRPRTSDPRR